MDYAVVGGDARFAYLVRMLSECGCDARWINGTPCDLPGVIEGTMEELAQAKNVVVNWPYAQSDQLLEQISPKARIFLCGPGNPEPLLGRWDAVDLWKDEQLKLENAWLTAEGAISAAMDAGARAMKDCHCLVIGWGRIGRALTELLIGLSARVTVASRSERGRNAAAERGAEGVSTDRMSEAVRGKQIIFSTAPERVLEGWALQSAESDVLVIDLASAPFGVDLDAARKLGIRAWREPKLPGRYCPISAARALMQAIFRAERERQHG